MRNRRFFLALVMVAVLLPGTGCLSLFQQQSDQKFPLTGHSKSKKAPSVLPAEESAEVCLATAQNLEYNGHAKQAAIQYEMARRYNPNLKNISRRLAVLYDRCGKPKEALAEYRKAIKENPRDINLLNNFGYHYYTRGKLKKAEEMYRKALKINDQHQAAWSNLGLVLAQQGRDRESLEAFEKAVSPAEALCNLAFVYTTMGKREMAKQAYRDALAQESTLQKARLALQKLEESDGSRPASATHVPSAKSGAINTPANSGMQTPANLQLPDELPSVTNESSVPDLSPVQVPTPGQTKELIGS